MLKIALMLLMLWFGYCTWPWSGLPLLRLLPEPLAIMVQML